MPGPTQDSLLRAPYDRALVHCGQMPFPKGSEDYDNCIIFYIDWETRELAREPAAGVTIVAALLAFSLLYFVVSRRRHRPR